MSRQSDQGQSLATIDKERRVGAALAVSMSIANQRFRDRGYVFWHFDANAGSGVNDEIGEEPVPGSPLVFWEAADRILTGMEAVPFFCDMNLARMRRLKTVLGVERAARSFLFPSDNNQALSVFARTILDSGERPEFVVGTALVDPNGWYYRNRKGEGVPSRILLAFLDKFPRIDLILNLNVSTYWKQAKLKHDVISPRNLLTYLRKEYWLVGKVTRGGNTYLQLIGRNMKTDPHKKVGLYLANSWEGQQILDVAEGKRQQPLEFGMPDVRGLSQAPGLSRGAVGRDAAGQGALLMRQEGDRGSPC